MLPKATTTQKNILTFDHVVNVPHEVPFPFLATWSVGRPRPVAAWLCILRHLCSSKTDTFLDLERIILSEVSQTEKDKYHMISLRCGIKNTTEINIRMKENRLRDQTCGSQGGGEGQIGSLELATIYLESDMT